MGTVKVEVCSPGFHCGHGVDLGLHVWTPHRRHRRSKLFYQFAWMWGRRGSWTWEVNTASSWTSNRLLVTLVHTSLPAFAITDGLIHVMDPNSIH